MGGRGYGRTENEQPGDNKPPTSMGRPQTDTLLRTGRGISAAAREFELFPNLTFHFTLYLPPRSLMHPSLPLPPLRLVPSSVSVGVPWLLWSLSPWWWSRVVWAGVGVVVRVCGM